MPVTTSSIMPDSGSSRNPHGTSNAPNPVRVASGIFGIHCATTTSYARASAGSPSSCQKATSAIPSAIAIVVHATTPAVRRENERMPTRPLIAAPMPGSRGISGIKRILVSEGAADAAAPPSRPHQIHFVDVDRLFVPVERENDPEADGRFRRRDRDHEDGEHLADLVLQLRRERDEVDVDRVQDQLDRHEDDDDVAPHHHAGYADDEERRGQQHVVSGCNHRVIHSSLFASTMAPIIATSSSMDATSNGI